jgi:hypothetical protein
MRFIKHTSTCHPVCVLFCVGFGLGVMLWLLLFGRGHRDVSPASVPALLLVPASFNAGVWAAYRRQTLLDLWHAVFADEAMQAPYDLKPWKVLDLVHASHSCELVDFRRLGLDGDGTLTLSPKSLPSCA